MDVYQKVAVIIAIASEAIRSIQWYFDYKLKKP